MAVQLSAGIGRTILTNSGAITASSATPNLRNIVAGGIPACEAVDILLSVTANTGTNSSNGPNFIELQTSPDGGTTWYTFWRSVNITTSTVTQRTSLRTNGIGANEAAATTVGVNTATATLTQNCCITQDQRVVWTLATSLANSPSINFGLQYIAQQSGTRTGY